jgi:hypothetical protein
VPVASRRLSDFIYERFDHPRRIYVLIELRILDEFLCMYYAGFLVKWIKHADLCILLHPRYAVQLDAHEEVVEPGQLRFPAVF